MEELKIYLDVEIFSELGIGSEDDLNFSWHTASVDIFSKVITVWDLMFEAMFSKHTYSLVTREVEKISPLSAVEVMNGWSYSVYICVYK